MAGRPGRKPAQPQQPAKPAFDELVEDGEGFEEDVPMLDAKGNPMPGAKSRDWRDVEKFREARELKKLIGEDLIDDLDFISIKPGKSQQ